MAVWLVYIAAVALILIWLNKKPANFPPGPPTIPIFGSFPFLDRTNFHYSLEKLRDKFGPVIGFKFGSHLACAVVGSAEILEILKRDDFNGRNNIIMPGRLAEGVMFGNGDIWKNQRRFFLRHVREFGYGKLTVSQMYNEEFDEFCKKIIKGQSYIKPSGLFNLSAINVLWCMIAGKRLDYDDADLKTLIYHIDRFFRAGHLNGGVINTVPGLRRIIKLFYTTVMDESDQVLRNFLFKHLNEHKKTKSGEPRDFLDVYINELENPEKHYSFHEYTLCEVLRDFFGAGTESAGNTVSYAIMYLLIHPEWQDKLHREIVEVIGSRRPVYEDHVKMPLMEAYMAETMRANTIAPFTVPHATTRDTTLAGYHLPKNTFVHVSVWGILQDKKHWGDPENFRPDRFIDKHGAFARDPYLIPFGTGARSCPGESLARNFVFLFFVSLIQRYKFTIPDGHPVPTTICKPGFTTAPQDFTAKITLR